MRTKVDKRRVRHDPPSALLTPASAAASLAETGGNVLLSSSSFHGSELPRDGERRSVSLNEAERLAAANHLVVALGPPVIIGPSRMMFDGKGDAAGLVVTGAGIVPAHAGDRSKAALMPENNGTMPEEKAIKKPPKKRRNNEKKMEVALDLSTTSSLHLTATTELHSPPLDGVMVHTAVPSLQQPPITPPTPSPQHQLTPPSPQHLALHNSALLCRSPPNPAPLLQQTPPSSSEPVLLDSGIDHMETMDNNHNSDIQTSLDKNTSVSQFLLSASQAAQVTGSDMVLTSSQNVPPHSLVTSITQPGAVRTLDAGEVDTSSATSTSMLQPPTWLLTPQEIPPRKESPAYEPTAASTQMTAETAAAHPHMEASNSSPILSSAKRTSKKVIKNCAAKRKSAKVKTVGEGGNKNKAGKHEALCETNGAVVAHTASKHMTTSTSKTQSVGVGTLTESGSKNEDSKSKSKVKKPPKKRPLVDSESSEERIAKIEQTINCVIARYVYDCDDVSKLHKLREAAREAEAKAEAENPSNANSSDELVAQSALSTDKSVDKTVESQSSADLNVQIKPPSETLVVKQKSPAKGRKSGKLTSEDISHIAVQAKEATADSDGKPPKKKPKRSRKKKLEEGGETAKEVGEEQKATNDLKTSAVELKNVHSELPPTEKVAEGKPQVTPKKKKASKKKTVIIAETSETQPVSDALHNGHIETTSTKEAAKTAKKKKSKAKCKDNTANTTSLGDSVKKEPMQVAGELTAPSVQPDGSAAAEKPSVKSKPKKAKKRKADVLHENLSAETKIEEDVNAETKTEETEHTEISKPPPKKKKKKEIKDGEITEPRKKKSPAKSKKAKQPQTDTVSAIVDEASVQQNGLPSTQSEGTAAEMVQNGETVLTGEVGTVTDDAVDTKSPVEKKVKKTLDEVICPDCGHKTRGQAALSRHMKKLHEKSVVLPYPCPKQPDCEYSASKVSLLARHMLTHSLFMCSRCQFTIDAKDQYEEHLQAEHNVKLDCKLCKKCNRYVKCDTVPMEKHLETCQGPVPFACDVCGKQFKYESSLKVHHHTHFPDQPKLFHCLQCEYSSNYRANLHKHVQNMHIKRPKDIKCLLCDKLFSTEDNMRRHMKIHTQVRPFKCDKCEKAFKSQCALRGHLVSHEVARPYRCNIDNCQREFRTPKFLKSHQEEFHRLIPKKYHCSVPGCEFSFFKLSHLKRHEISHTGERNFHCSHPGCGKSFRHSDNLKVHLRQHTNERPISCDHCKFTCRQKSSLQWHLKKEHNQILASSGSENSSDEITTALEVKFPDGFKLPGGMKLPEGVELLPMAEGVRVVEMESVNVIVPASEGDELPVTITELRPMDLYDFHSDNDSSDEATPGVFKRDKTKMASAAPLPPPPKELLLKNSVLDVLKEEENKPMATDELTKPKKKKSPSQKTTKPKDSVSKKGEEGGSKTGTAAEGDEGKKKRKKSSPVKKASPEAKKKTPSTKSKKKKVENPENMVDKPQEGKEGVEENSQCTKTAVDVAETSTEAKPVTKTKKSPAKKKIPAKQTAKESKTVEEKEIPTKAKAPAKSKRSPKTHASPKKPSSPKGRLAKPATRKTPPRKAATAKKGGKTLAKKAPAKKGSIKKKSTPKKKSSPKKKAAKKGKDKKEEASVQPKTGTKEVLEDTAPTLETKPKEKPVAQKRSQSMRRSRETRNSAAAVEEASSPLRSGSPMDSEEENMPQGAGSPYCEFDSQDMDDSSPDSPSPIDSPNPVEEPLVQSPAAVAEETSKEEENTLPQVAEEMQEAEHHDEALSSDAEDLINDIPLTPPRAPAPPPPESSDEEEMIPSPPTHMPLSADTSDTAAPSSVLTDQPGSQATEFQQPQSADYPQHHSREEYPQHHSREEYPQHHSREEYPQHHSREEYPQQHSREEYPQHHSREEYPQHHSREEYPQHHSREEYPQHHSREEYPQHHSREEYPQHHSREEYPQHHSREEYPQHHSREEYPQHHSGEEYPQHHSREEYSQHHSREEYHTREEYPQQHSREELMQQHSREELQPQGSVPEPVSEPVPSVHSEGLPEDVAMPHSVVQYDPVASQTAPTSEAESAYQYLQGLAQSGETISEPLAGEPSRLQQLEALAEKPHEDSRNAADVAKSPVGAAPTSVITSLSPTLAVGASETSHRRMEILATDRQVEQALLRDTPSTMPRLPDGAYDAYSALNPLTASAARDNSNLFPAPPSTPGFMRLTESEAMLQRQRMTTPFLPSSAQPPERSLSRLPESSLQPPNPSALLRRTPTMAEGMFPGAPGMPQAMQRNPFANTWASQDVRPTHWGQTPTYLQRPSNAATSPFPFSAGREFMFDPTVRPSVTDRNMFASLSTAQSQRDLASEPSPFQLDRFDLSTYFGSHAYSGASSLDYSRAACGTTPKTFDERYRQSAASMSEFRPLPSTTTTDMFSGIGVGVNSLNSAGFNLDKYAMYGRDPMYHAAAQQLSDNTNSAFLTHATPTQHSMFDRDYPHRSLYPHQNPAYPLFNDRQYPTAAKLAGHPTPSAMSQERDFMSRQTANENQMQDPYRCGMLYNVMNRYTFE